MLRQKVDTAIIYVPASLSAFQVMNTIRKYPSIRLGRMRPGRVCHKLILRGSAHELYTIQGDLS